jgi:ATP-dependent DNA helicase RecQ
MNQPSIHDLLHTRFGFPAFREGQQAVVERLVAGHSVLAVFPTGGGKSLCYQLPALAMEGLTLVVSPLIALMKDQIDELHRKGIAAARLDSSLSTAEYREVWADVKSGATRILYVAPERFQNERFMAQLRGLPIAMMAIDEAHCISEWGHNFRPDYLKLANIAQQIGAERVLALTATATPAVSDGIRAAFAIFESDHIHTEFHRPNLFLRMQPVHESQRDSVLLERIRQTKPGATIVYVTLQHTAEKVAKNLEASGRPVRAYHAGMKAEERTDVQDWFMATPDAIVVATIAFGMGIDKADIRYVYHYNLPKALENYAQEIGRAGRDGLPATCELMASPSDATTLKNFSYGDTPSAEAVLEFVSDVLSKGDEFDVSQYALSTRHDIRSLVVSTLLTYLELEGVLASTAPFYDTYKFKPNRSSREILAQYDPERADFLKRVLACSTKARTWFSIELTESAERLNEPRQRLVAAMDFLAEKGDLELSVSGIRHGYRVVARPDVERLAATLAQRFAEAEVRDIARIDGVMALTQQQGCLTQTLLSYFGEPLGPCGHCDRCAGEPLPSFPPIVAYTFTATDRDLVANLPTGPAMHTQRQQARFLCGLNSPAAARARLRGKPGWGRLQHVPFDQVLAFVGEA